MEKIKIMTKVYNINNNISETTYMFPAELINLYRDENYKTKLYFCQIGEKRLPIGAFVYRIYSKENNKIIKIEILYLKIIPQLTSKQVYTSVLYYLMNNHKKSKSKVKICFEVTKKDFTQQAFKEFSIERNLIKTHERYDVKLYHLSNNRHWKILAKLFRRNYRLATRDNSNRIYSFKNLDKKCVKKIEQTIVPEWANPFNRGLFSQKFSEHSYVFFEDNRPRAWVIASIVGESSLLIETLWTDFKGNYDIIYSILYIQFIKIWGYNMDQNLGIDSCIFCFQSNNSGMSRLIKRMGEFRCEVNKTYQLEGIF